MILYKDSKGVGIRTGSIVRCGKRKGVILNNEIDGQYVKFSNGFKLRVEECAKKLKVIGPGVSKEIENGVILDGIRRY